MTNPAALLERSADEHLQQHPHDPQEHSVVDVPGITLEPPKVVGWFGLADSYDEAFATMEPCAVEFAAAVAGQQVTTLRPI